MALEDSPRRLQRRIEQPLPGREEWSPRLTLCHHMERLDQGGLEEIRAWAASVPTPSVAVIDTFAKVRPGKLGSELPYDADYRHMGLLQQLATDLGISVVVVHHQRKMEATDPLDTASGSTGLTGAADFFSSSTATARASPSTVAAGTWTTSRLQCHSIR